MSTPPPAFPQPLVELTDAMFPVLVQFPETGSLAPHAAVCGADGEITGSALVTDGVESADASFTVVIPYERAASGAWDYRGPRVYLKERSVFVDLTAGGSA